MTYYRFGTARFVVIKGKAFVYFGRRGLTIAWGDRVLFSNESTSKGPKA